MTLQTTLFSLLEPGEIYHINVTPTYATWSTSTFEVTRIVDGTRLEETVASIRYCTLIKRRSRLSGAGEH